MSKRAVSIIGFLVGLLILLMCCQASRGASVVFNFQMGNSAPVGIRTLKLYPTGTFTNGAGVSITRDYVSGTTDAGGLLTVSNVYGWTYRGEVTGPNAVTTNYYNFPVTNGTIQAADYIGTPTNQTLTYSQAQIDGSFAHKVGDTFSGGVTNYSSSGFVGNGGGLTGVVANVSIGVQQLTNQNGFTLTNVNGTNIVGTLTNNTTGQATTALHAGVISQPMVALLGVPADGQSFTITGATPGMIGAQPASTTLSNILGNRFTTNADNASISGANLTSLNASQLTSGTVPDARNGHPNVFNTNSVGANGVLDAPIGLSAYSNSFVKLFSPPGGNNPIPDMQSAPAADYVGQLGLSWAGFKEMSLWVAGRTGFTGSNAWDWSDLSFPQGIGQIGDPRIMPSSVPTPNYLSIYFNGNAEYSRLIYARTNSGARNASYLRLNNMNPFTDGNGIMMPMYGTNFGGLPAVLTNNDGVVIYPWDQFGLTILSIPGTYTVGETNMAGSYDIITGVGNSIPLYICCNAQLGNEPVLGQKAWVAFDNRYLADSSKPAATHFQMWRPNVYAFTNANNVDVFMVEHSPEHARIEIETNVYVHNSSRFWVTNQTGNNAFATGARIDLSKNLGIECNTNLGFHWSSSDQSKGLMFTLDDYLNYRNGWGQKFGQYPKFVHSSNSPWTVARSSVTDLQTDLSAQTWTDELTIDASDNLDLETASNYLANITVHNAAVSGKYGSGTDGAASNLTLVGGKSTGTGRGGAVVLQTTPSASGSGSTLNTLVTRTYISAKSVALTKSSATLVFNVSLASAKMMGLRIFATTTATDNTDFQSRADSIFVSAVNKAGTVTTAISTLGTGDTAAALSTGTMTTTWTAVANGNGVDIKCNAVPSLTPAAGALLTTWRIDLDTADTGATITPQ